MVKQALHYAIVAACIVIACVPQPVCSVNSETYETRPGFYRSDTFGCWHTKNLKTKSSATPALSIVNNSRNYDPDLLLTSKLEDPELQFDEAIWKQRSKKRVYMLKDLLVCHPVIGMNRAAVHNLLGSSDVPEWLKAPKDTVTTDAEWYRLAEPFTSCLISSPHYSTILSLELSYKKDKVSKFRIVASKAGHCQVDGVNPFDAQRKTDSDSTTFGAPETKRGRGTVN